VGAKYYFSSHRKGMPVSCRHINYWAFEEGQDCLLAGGDYRRQDLWDEGLGDYWPRENQPGREVSEAS
jgi:hypothetical protein